MELFSDRNTLSFSNIPFKYIYTGATISTGGNGGGMTDGGHIGDITQITGWNTVQSEYEITEETSFKDDLGADSLDLFELVMRCEEEYEIEFPSDDLENIKTVGDVMNYIKAQGIEA